jgi:FkbM family methyltransferase
MKGLIYFIRRAITRSLAHIGSHQLLLRWRAWEDMYFGEPEIRLLKYLVDPERIAIDIGAAEGVYAFYLQRLAKRCIAFEPNPESYLHLRRALPRVELHQAAASASDGVATLRVPVVKGIPYSGWGSIEPRNRFTELPAHTLSEVKVRTIRPDRMATGDVGFVKIDVEGHEQDVLTGLSDLLDRCLPNILIEIGGAQRGGSLSEVCRRLDPLGYIGFKLNKQGVATAIPKDGEIKDAINVIFIAPSTDQR